MILPVARQSRTLKLDLWLVALVGLLAQGFWAARLAHPTSMDGYYYATNGQRLSAGHGFTEMVIWQYLDDPAGLPAPSHTYWMPLPSLLAAAGYRLWPHWRGAQLPFWLLVGLLPVLAYLISRLLTGERWQAWAAALFTAAGGFFSSYWSQPETFAPFAWAGALCLLALGRASHSGPVRWWLLVGVTAGLAHLTRADGLLFLLVGLLAWAGQFRGRPTLSALRPATPALLALLLGYLWLLGGWFGRNWLLFGRPLPTVGAQTLFLTSYDDLFAYGRTLHLADLLAWGASNLLRSRLEAIWLAGQSFVAVACLVFLTPFVLVAWLHHLRRPPGQAILRPLTLYTLALFAVMTLLFTFPGQRGGLFHSSVALWPWTMALAPAGLALAVNWTAARLPHWRPQRAQRLFAALFVVVAFLLSLIVGLQRPLATGEATVYRQLAALLPPDAVVMVGNPPAFFYHTGRAAIVVPNEPLPVALAAARRYGAAYLVLDENRPPPLNDLYTAAQPPPPLRRLAVVGQAVLFSLDGPGP